MLPFTPELLCEPLIVFRDSLHFSGSFMLPILTKLALQVLLLCSRTHLYYELHNLHISGRNCSTIIPGTYMLRHVDFRRCIHHSRICMWQASRAVVLVAVMHGAAHYQQALRKLVRKRDLQGIHVAVWARGAATPVPTLV